MSILANIQLLCKKNSTSVPKLEKELGFGNGSIYNWDKNSPSADKLQKVAEFFKVSTDYLILGYDKSRLFGTLVFIKGSRSVKQFAEDSGVSEDEMFNLFTNNYPNLPPLETLEKIVANNPINPLITRNEILEIAGYDPEKTPEPTFTKVFPNETTNLVIKDEQISVFDDPAVRALARKSFSKDPTKEALLKKLIKSMLEED
ncbi:transcriptional regulator with XRE-family HTH domain [Sporomusaceae bacterium BoRhaA]|uniref:helix-turn-helix domain-containing protein n=1 Tax=Pelorhabdus rhamnosifermentans TaxID=2772457 RepID=UPI001C064266|nr:helix-turn-helix transcriptional regulator [Pelorhabdus rhamnosifermentans]MBU2701756.1 transcriptional regulator with XRE-family HTH domain [Pelorhabdus rhamnosifermentans]